MNKFTPGPWKVTEYTVRPADENTPLREYICEVNTFPLWFPEGNVIAKANARLIAAAPELFEELTALLEFARQYGPSPRTPYEDWKGFFESAEKVLNSVNEV